MISNDLLKVIKLVIFDFDGVFTDNTVMVSENGIESVRCWRSDGLGISRIHSIGIQTFIISSEINPVVTMRANKLKIPCIHGSDNKAKMVIEVCKKTNVSLAQTMFLGNDINDVDAFQTVGVPVAVADAYPEVLPHVIWQTNKPGGKGAVREVCDLIFNAKQN